MRLRWPSRTSTSKTSAPWSRATWSNSTTGAAAAVAGGRPRDTAIRPLADVPFVHPALLHARVRRYRCIDCAYARRQTAMTAAESMATLSRTAPDSALEGLGIKQLSVSRIAAHLGVARNVENDAVLAEGQRRLITDPPLRPGERHRRRRFPCVAALPLVSDTLRRRAALEQTTQEAGQHNPVVDIPAPDTSSKPKDSNPTYTPFLSKADGALDPRS